MVAHVLSLRKYSEEEIAELLNMPLTFIQSVKEELDQADNKDSILTISSMQDF